MSKEKQEINIDIIHKLRREGQKIKADLLLQEHYRLMKEEKERIAKEVQEKYNKFYYKDNKKN